MTDTHPEIYLKQLEVFLAKSDAEKFGIIEELYLFGRKVTENNILSENKNLSETDIKVEVFRRCYASLFSLEELDRITDSMRKYLQWNE
jgi:hypothetical protein